jgi:hypothetical protein
MVRALAARVTRLVTGHLRDTLHTSTCFHRLSNQRPTTRLPQSTAIYGNLPFSTIFYHILPNSAKSDWILLSSARTITRSLFYPVYVLTKQPSQRYIPFSPYSLTFSPYATSWPYYIVYVYSLIISTSLYIIAAYARSVIGRDFTDLYLGIF